MALAPVAYLYFNECMRYDPKAPHWPGRDRFVLSPGHACMLQYATLHLTGYDVSLDDLKQFRQWGSLTPGHPEVHHTPGIEVTTGPLGQGVGNIVGFALAERMLAARYNRPGHEIIDHRVFGICSDGDLMEGVSAEAASLAGHLGLGKLVFLYDDNKITIDGAGNFKDARVIRKEETVIPATEKSATRVGTKPPPHPLCDKVQYCAEDYPSFGGGKPSFFNEYQELLSAWCSSAYSHPKARAVLKYVRQGTLVRDLVREKVREDDFTVLLASPLGGPEHATPSGYARTVRVWQRGADPLAAPVIFSAGPTSMVAYAYPDREATPERLVFVERTGFFDGIVQVFDCPHYMSKGKYDVDENGSFVPLNEAASKVLYYMDFLKDHEENPIRAQKYLNQEDKLCMNYKFMMMKLGHKKQTKQIPYEWVYPKNWSLKTGKYE